MTTESRVIAILGRYAEPGGLDAPLHEIDLLNLGIDSAELINLIIAVEDAFDLDVTDEYVHELRTVADIVRAVDRMRSVNA